MGWLLLGWILAPAGTVFVCPGITFWRELEKPVIRARRLEQPVGTGPLWGRSPTLLRQCEEVLLHSYSIRKLQSAGWEIARDCSDLVSAKPEYCKVLVDDNEYVQYVQYVEIVRHVQYVLYV